MKVRFDYLTQQAIAREQFDLAHELGTLDDVPHRHESDSVRTAVHLHECELRDRLSNLDIPESIIRFRIESLLEKFALEREDLDSGSIELIADNVAAHYLNHQEEYEWGGELDPIDIAADYYETARVEGFEAYRSDMIFLKAFLESRGVLIS